jgi:DNA invertase Pin-like site-specific DNA recombinase
VVEPLDDTPEGQVMAGFRAGSASREVLETRERTNRGLRAKASRQGNRQSPTTLRPAVQAADVRHRRQADQGDRQRCLRARSHDGSTAAVDVRAGRRGGQSAWLSREGSMPSGCCRHTPTVQGQRCGTPRASATS